MQGNIYTVRDGNLALTLPASTMQIKSDGTLWWSGCPLLGTGDVAPAEKAKLKALVAAHKYGEIPAEYYCRMGDNPNGLWVGDEAGWANHPAKAEHARAEAEKRAISARQVRIYLSSRGWGDYAPADWVGDITRPDAEILAECKARLAWRDDIDQPDQSDEEIMAKIAKARADWEAAPARKAAREAAEAADIKRKIETGYCFSCGTWCHGDCGHYSADPQVMYRRQFREMAREASYGLSEED